MRINRPQVLCDICGADITHAPGTAYLTLTMGYGNGSYVEPKFSYEDTCKACRHQIYLAIGQKVKELRDA